MNTFYTKLFEVFGTATALTVACAAFRAAGFFAGQPGGDADTYGPAGSGGTGSTKGIAPLGGGSTGKGGTVGTGIPGKGGTVSGKTAGKRTIGGAKKRPEGGSLYSALRRVIYGNRDFARRNLPYYLTQPEFDGLGIS